VRQRLAGLRHQQETGMRQTSRIESLSYGTIYVTGCIVAALLSLSQHNQMQQTVVHVACSWGYVIYWLLNLR
jgi:hypothetical protein